MLALLALAALTASTLATPITTPVPAPIAASSSGLATPVTTPIPVPDDPASPTPSSGPVAQPYTGARVAADHWLDAHKYLTVQDGILANGTPVVMDYYKPDPKWQVWTRPGDPAEFPQAFRVGGTEFCLDAGENPQSGSKVKIWQCYYGLLQQNWEYFNDGFRIVGTNLCLDKTDGRDSAGTQVQVWECVEGNSNQVWDTPKDI